MKLDVYNVEGNATGKQVDLPENIFGIEPHEHSIYLAVKQYLAHLRQGTHKAKERGEIKGSTKKIKKQKGTGTARAGSLKNPLFRGGGRVFGPRPRNYSIHLNKKVKALARMSALASKARNNEVRIVEDFTFEAPSTKSYNNILKNLDISGKKTLLLAGERDEIVRKSVNNIAGASVANADDFNVYEVLNSNVLLISEGAIDRIKEVFTK